MKVFKAIKEGAQLVYGYQRYIFLVYAINFLLALALASVVAADIEASLGNSLSAESLRRGFDNLWYQGFSASAQGVSETFDPSVAGIGAVFNGLDEMLQGKMLSQHPGILWSALSYWLLWCFLSAGFITIYGQMKLSFFRGAEKFFLRFLILSLGAGLIYIMLFSAVLPLMNQFVEQISRDFIDERPLFLYTVGKYLLLWGMICFVSMLLDFSKIATVRWNIPRKSIHLAPRAALDFLRHYPFRSLGLYLMNGIFWFLAMGIYWLIAPGGGERWWVSIFFVIIIGQIYIVTRIALKCLFYASETRFFFSGYEIPEQARPATNPAEQTVS